MRSTTDGFVRFARQVMRAEDKPITLFCLVAGILITLFQYWQFLETKRVEVSYQHVQEWEEAGYKEAFERLSKVIRTSEATTRASLPDDFTVEQGRLAQLNVVQRLLVDDAEGSIGDDIDKLVYFFDKLSVCVDRNLCDADLLSRFFKDNLKRLWIYSSSFVAKRREEIRGYAELTESYQAILPD